MISSNGNQIECQLSLSSAPEPGVILPAKVRVDNLGDAVIAQTGEWYKGYTLSPRVSGIDYPSGSLAGGHLITIEGGSSRHSVQINQILMKMYP